jgi:hypothetical protein
VTDDQKTAFVKMVCGRPGTESIRPVYALFILEVSTDDFVDALTTDARFRRDAFSAMEVNQYREDLEVFRGV